MNQLDFIAIVQQKTTAGELQWDYSSGRLEVVDGSGINLSKVSLQIATDPPDLSSRDDDGEQYGLEPTIHYLRVENKVTGEIAVLSADPLQPALSDLIRATGSLTFPNRYRVDNLLEEIVENYLSVSPSVT